MAIQPVPSACSMIFAAGQRLAAVEDADVVEAQEAALENVPALRVLAIHPPGEVEQQLVEDALQEVAIGARRAASARSCRRARPPRHAPAD